MHARPFRLLHVLLGGLLAASLAACTGGGKPAPTLAPIVPTSNVTPLTPTLAPTPPASIQPTITAVPAPTNAPPTVVPVPQQVFIETPPPGTVVGSPVVLTGRLARPPASGMLNYQFVDANNAQLGAGAFHVEPNDGQSIRFSASLIFQQPANGGPIRALLFEIDSTSGAQQGLAAIDLYVAAPQQITIESPPSGTVVGSPVVLTGRLARLPFQSNLAYLIFNGRNQRIGAGIIPVSGAPGRPTNFVGSLTFALPPDGGSIRIELLDQNAENNAIAARASIDLQVAPQPQAIIITSPPINTLVGSPVVLTGRTVRYPFQGNLGYRIIDAYGTQLGTGAFPVNGAPGASANFNVSIGFNLPPNGGPIRIDLYDQDSFTGITVAQTAITLQVAPQQPPSGAPPAQQRITIETPPTGTLVGSPLVVTGRTARIPFEGNLAYRIRNERGEEIGRGSFGVTPDGQGAAFVASLFFQMPNFGTTIRVEIFEQDQATGALTAIAAVDLRIR